MKIIFLISLLLSSVFSVAKPIVDPEQSKDFFTFYDLQSGFHYLDTPILKNPSKLSDCRDRIQKLVCLANPVESGNPDDGYNRPCLNGSEQYAIHFERHFDRSHELIQKMYCHLTKIFIEQNSEGTAYAGPVMDAGNKMIGALFGIRKEILGANLSFDSWLSWKEETTFGGGTISTGPRMGLIEYKSNKASNDFLIDYVIAHEFGHLFDFANGLQKRNPGSWADISWVNFGEAKPEFDFPLRDKICFYFCEGKFLDKKDAVTMFTDLLKTNFLSPYASRYGEEDWAESLALYLYTVNNGLKLEVTVSGQTFNLTEHFYSPLMKEKRDYIEGFLKSSYIYPGE